MIKLCPKCHTVIGEKAEMIFYRSWGPMGTYYCLNCKSYWREVPSVLLEVDKKQIEEEKKHGLGAV